MKTKFEINASVFILTCTNLFFLSSTQIYLIGVYNLSYYQLSKSLYKKVPKAIIDNALILNPIYCQLLKSVFTQYTNSCDLSIVLSLTLAELHIGLYKKFTEDQAESIPLSALRKFLYVGSRAMLTNFLFEPLNIKGFFGFMLASIPSVYINESLKPHSIRGISMANKMFSKSLSAYTAKELLKGPLESFKGCNPTAGFLSSCAGIAIFSLHDFLREGLYGLYKYGINLSSNAKRVVPAFKTHPHGL